MRVLITGCGGMLGEAVFPEFGRHHDVLATDIDVNETWLSRLDVRSVPDVNKAVSVFEPEVVLHLAAITDMEHCQTDPELAYDTNFMGALNVARAAARAGAVLVYISSAGIFDGLKQRYDENDVPNPLNVYAKSKYMGELISLSYPKAIVVRAGWMMGGGPRKDKKFVNKIIKQIRSGATELFVVKDKHGTPTYTYELAETLRFLVEEGRRGLFHGCCAGGGTRVDVAKAVVAGLGLKGVVAVNEVSSDYFKEEYFAVRPESEKLVSVKINSVPTWRDCLYDYLRRFDW